MLLFFLDLFGLTFLAGLWLLLVGVRIPFPGSIFKFLFIIVVIHVLWILSLVPCDVRAEQLFLLLGAGTAGECIFFLEFTRMMV